MYLIDTDILIYALKGDATVAAQFRKHAANPKAISVITYGELVYGAEKSARRDANLARVRRIAELFPLIDVTRAITETFASLKKTLEKRGERVDDFDLIVAATALSMGYSIVTNNERHFRRVPGLTVENWSKP